MNVLPVIDYLENGQESVETYAGRVAETQKSPAGIKCFPAGLYDGCY